MRGEKLAGTDDINPLGDQNFSLSPDGNWLLYASSHGNMLAPVYVLYDTRKRQRHEIELSSRVRTLSAEGRGPLARAGCWEADGTRVVLPGDRTLFVADVRSTRAQWEVIATVDSQEFLRYYECPEASGKAPPGIRVNQRSSRRVDIVDAGSSGTVLIEHEAHTIGANRISIRFLTASPDGKRLAYLVTEYSGSFVTSSTAYLLDLRMEPGPRSRHLADHVLGPVRWSADNKFVYACVGNARGSKGLYQWSFEQ